MSPTWLRPRWLFNRRVAKTLLWTMLLLAAAVAANIAGIHYLGSVVGWERWLAEASGYFLLWRLCLYTARRATGGYGCAGACWRAKPAQRRSAASGAPKSPAWRESSRLRPAC